MSSHRRARGIALAQRRYALHRTMVAVHQAHHDKLVALSGDYHARTTRPVLSGFERVLTLACVVCLAVISWRIFR